MSNKFVQFCKKYDSKRKEKNAKKDTQARVEIIENKFSLSCREGKLFLLCNSTAVETLSDDTTVKDILQKIDDMKKSETEFSKNSSLKSLLF